MARAGDPGDRSRPPVRDVGPRWTLTERWSGPTASERAQVIEIYERDIRTLETLIHRDLSSWLDPEKSAS